MRAELALIAALLGGCSVASMERLGGHRRHETPRCTASAAPVAIDGLLAGAYAVAAGVALGDDRIDNDGAVMAAGVSVIAVASALYGWRETRRCERARAAHDRWLEIERRRRDAIGAPGAD